MIAFLVIFLSTFFQVLSARIDPLCPAPCTCSVNSVNCSRLQLTDLIGLEHQIGEYDRVDISFNQLTRVPELQIKTLNISFNSVSDIPESLDRLQELYLKNNLVRYASLKSDHVEILDLSYNPVQEVFLISRSLLVVDLSHGDLEVIPDNFLDSLPSLRALNLADNPIKRLPELRSQSLQELWVERTQLRYIKHTTFSKLSQLRILNLRENKHIHKLRIESSAQLLVAELGSLEEVNLTGMPKLTTLSLNHNRIHNLQLPETIEEIHARNNFLTVLSPLKKLRKADLSNNILVSVQFHDMDWLNISGNPLKHLKLESMRYLDASHCHLEAIECTKAKFHTLNLSGNFLENFSCRIGVQLLDLSYNRLSAFRVKLEGVHEVNLTGNRIVLAEDVIPQGRMYLDDNPWTCDCNMQQLYVAAENKNTLYCSHPTNVSGLTWTAACYKAKIPNWMRRYPYIPFISCCLVLFLLGIVLYWLRGKLDLPPPTPEEIRRASHVVAVPVVRSPSPHNQLPSYEEALLMPAVLRKSHALTQTRSYEILSHRLSSSSI